MITNTVAFLSSTTSAALWVTYHKIAKDSLNRCKWFSSLLNPTPNRAGYHGNRDRGLNRPDTTGPQPGRRRPVWPGPGRRRLSRQCRSASARTSDLHERDLARAVVRGRGVQERVDLAREGRGGELAGEIGVSAASMHASELPALVRPPVEHGKPRTAVPAAAATQPGGGWAHLEPWYT